MNDIDTRARAAASGLRRAVDDFTITTSPRPEPRGRRPLILALAGLVAITLVVGGVIAVRDKRSGAPSVLRPGGPISSANVGGYPYSIAVDPRGVFVANQQAEVIRLDRRTGAIATRVPTERRTYQVVTDPEHGIWGFGGGDGADTTGDLVFLAPSTVRPPTTVHLEHGASAVAFTAGRVWVLDVAGNLSARDLDTLQVTSQINVPGAENGGWLAVGGGRLWVLTPTVLYRFDPSDIDVPLRPGEARGLRTSAFALVRLTGDERFRSVAVEGRWLWDSVCTDQIGNRCFLERRDLKTGALEKRFTGHLLAPSYGGSTGAAGGIVGAGDVAWAIEADGPSLIRTTSDGNVERVLTIPAALRTAADPQYPNFQFRYFTVGAGALWYSVPEDGRIYRIPLP